jgi:hypothetical protein
MLCTLQEVTFILLASCEVFEPNGCYLLKMASDIHEGFTKPHQTETLKMSQQLLTKLTRLIFHVFAILFKCFLNKALGLS